jgi:hypothetical protein
MLQPRHPRGQLLVGRRKLLVRLGKLHQLPAELGDLAILACEQIRLIREPLRLSPELPSLLTHQRKQLVSRKLRHARHATQYTASTPGPTARRAAKRPMP